MLVKPRRVPDWETVRIFLEVLRSGSFRAASDRLGQSINALRRKVDELEHTLGVILLTRHVDGVRATAEGDKIHSAALRMEAASFDLLQARNSTKKGCGGRGPAGRDRRPGHLLAGTSAGGVSARQPSGS